MIAISSSAGSVVASLLLLPALASPFPAAAMPRVTGSVAVVPPSPRKKLHIFRDAGRFPKVMAPKNPDEDFSQAMALAELAAFTDPAARGQKKQWQTIKAVMKRMGFKIFVPTKVNYLPNVSMPRWVTAERHRVLTKIKLDLKIQSARNAQLDRDAREQQAGSSSSFLVVPASQP